MLASSALDMASAITTSLAQLMKRMIKAMNSADVLRKIFFIFSDFKNTKFPTSRRRV
jgi:hypothetical protein